MIEENRVIDYNFNVGQWAYIMASVAGRTLGYTPEQVDIFAAETYTEYLSAANALADDAEGIMRDMDKERAGL